MKARLSDTKMSTAYIVGSCVLIELSFDTFSWCCLSPNMPFRLMVILMCMFPSASEVSFTDVNNLDNMDAAEL